ncbi:hypothetical protein [Luteipulveratus mongoliensis]|uniref:Uncharacterized protein n=1 Tax=Luteipulveratus mongoliensis TaxID=571913 RepID=A0A0K1JDA6_9MICO|nr:hypothetical protein [Luteipulveratus mongoliensis]AKU14684.1 hypothetical protein VV02_00360 [Luteipulveratus mongoliensis]
MTGRESEHLWGPFDPHATPAQPEAHVELPEDGLPRVAGIEIPRQAGESAEDAAVAALARQAQRLPGEAVRATFEGPSGTRRLVIQADGTRWDLDHAVRPTPAVPLRRVLAACAVAAVMVGGVAVAVVSASGDGPDRQGELSPVSTTATPAPVSRPTETSQITSTSAPAATGPVPDVVAATGAPPPAGVGAVPSSGPVVPTSPGAPQPTSSAPRPPAPPPATPRPRKTVPPKTSSPTSTIHPPPSPTPSMPTIPRGPRIVRH